MRNITPRRFTFSKLEIRDLIRSWIAITIAFSIARATMMSSLEEFIVNGIMSAIVVGAAFLLHEMAHKYIAIQYRCSAEFRANNSMLVMMIFISFLGIILAAPGAVHIQGHISRKEYGIISLAGPATNIILALISIPLTILMQGTLLGQFASYSVFINSWLAMFNMIPFGMFDGSKIISWNREVYYTTLIISFILVGVSQSI